MNQTVLITGGAGYLGSVLVGILLKKGYRVRVFDILMFGGESLLSHLYHPYFTLVNGDIRKKYTLERALYGVDMVCHLAALVGEPACAVNSKLTKEVNVSATRTLLSLAKQNGVKRFIYTSTCSNYGVTSRNDIADESYPLKPLSLYAKTKIAAEKLVLSEKNDHFVPVILRFGTLFGLSPKMRFNLLLNEIVRDAYIGNRIIVYQPSAWRPYLHIADAADAVTLLLEANSSKVSGQIFNVVEENITKHDLIARVKKYFPKIQVTFVGDKDHDDRNYRVKSDKIKQIIGFTPKRTISMGIAEMKQALTEKVFTNPSDKRYLLWLDTPFKQ